MQTYILFTELYTYRKHHCSKLHILTNHIIFRWWQVARKLIQKYTCTSSIILRKYTKHICCLIKGRRVSLIDFIEEEIMRFFVLLLCQSNRNVSKNKLCPILRNIFKMSHLVPMNIWVTSHIYFQISFKFTLDSPMQYQIQYWLH